MSATQNFSIDTLLVGYENQENLGLRSIMAYLQNSGYTVGMIPFSPDRESEILEAIELWKPRLIGFSLIFQYSLNEFQQLMHILRENDINAHFTAGGHFPSLRPEVTLKTMPELDSIVRFEGELTLIELLDNLNNSEKWQNIKSLAYRSDTEVILTPLRPLIDNLDNLPYVYRDATWQSFNGVNMASMLASRGCWFNCSFCSIRQFYGKPTGILRRTRSPQNVVDEMLTLFNESNVRFFSFQDDDFAARTKKQRKWLNEFLSCLAESRLATKAKWKISCRVDDLEPHILEKMIEHGLMAVYLGIESGSNESLRMLNKHVTVEQNLSAIELIKRHNIALAIGFMLFDPSSTVATLQDNLQFLRAVSEDGYFPINFCKMLPYAGTPIETQLRNEDRLTGSITHPDYDFIDPRVNWYAFIVQRIFAERNFSPKGLVARLLRIDFNLRLQNSLSGNTTASEQDAHLRKLIQRSNLLALSTLETLLDRAINYPIKSMIDQHRSLVDIAEQEWRGEAEIEVELEAFLKSKYPSLSEIISERSFIP